ncbi:PRTRC system ThiF family protein [Mucilaginibacter sp. L196]|uniref:PRTRC system ThiF family protein n=1 Tax=Mucilaginibacter sp. L196 TaxID=1641870 RepID=UPI00131D9F1E|nr:PRTRC system ThiF family protein [Mucilaginibacter sp. L196]
MSALPAVHITDNFIINPPNPITVNLVGAGGTGSQMLTALARINHALINLNHPGLSVTVYDDDRISEANLGRQLFSESEVGFYKSVVLVNRLNRFFGTNWKAKNYRFADDLYYENSYKANLYISCVDTAKSRFEISEMLYDLSMGSGYDRERPLYWMDLGNSRDTGQVVLSTIGNIKQPESEKYKTVADLPFITEMFRDQLEQADKLDDTPSCSLAEALTKQDLFINSSVANLGASLLWQLFQQGMIFNRGMFVNLKTFITQPLKLA